MEPKRIYLDTRDWIILARVANGKETDPELVEVYQKIKKLSDSGHAIFPISLFHLEDMMVNSKEEQRKKLVEFMVSISKGWVLQPYNLNIDKEVTNATLHRMGKDSYYDIKSEILSKGLPYFVSTGYEITWNKSKSKSLPEDFEQKLRKEIDKPESMAKILKDYIFSKRFKEGRKLYIEAAQEMEKNRLQKMKMEKKTRYNVAVANYIDSVIGPRLGKILVGTSRETKDIAIPKTREEMEKFLEDMPAINIVFRLTYGRDEFWGRTVQTNDITDINHLAVSVPYCDIVVMEKTFASLCQKLGLDKKYGSTVLRSLKDLNKII